MLKFFKHFIMFYNFIMFKFLCNIISIITFALKNSNLGKHSLFLQQV